MANLEAKETRPFFWKRVFNPLRWNKKELLIAAAIGLGLVLAS